MRRLTSFMLALAVLPVVCQAAWAQGGACATQSIPITTGASGSGVLPQGSGDVNWTVIADPDANTAEPRPAFVIDTNAAWKSPLPGSTWISSYPGSLNTTNGKYVFRYCFCLNAGFFANPNLQLSLRADDQADVFLNGGKIGSTPNPSYATALPATIPPPPASAFVAGRNCLTVELNNIGSFAMGLNLAGSIAASGLAVQKPECCNPTGQIQGRKWNDADGDGVLDTNELGLAGWTIKLSNGATAVTDVLGFYSFFGIPPGNYTISEIPQSGWQQTFPAGGTHQVAVGANQLITGKDFGNRQGPPCSRIQTVGTVICELGPNGQLTGNFVWTFTLTNLSNKAVSHFYFDGLPAGVTVDRPHIVFAPPIPPGGVRTETVVIRGATAGQTLTLPIVLLDAALQACCSFSVSLPLPDCRCAQILSDVTPSCFPFLPPPYRYTFNLQNLEPTLVSSVIATPVILPNTPISPAVLDVAPVPIHLSSPIGIGGQTGNKTVVVTGSGAVPGSQVCLLLSLHDLNCEHCCSIPRCFTLPSCFIDDIIFYPIGDSIILFDELGLLVSGIGSSGDDGVGVQTSGAAAVEVGWLPLAPATPSGASISVGASAGGSGSEHALGSLEVTSGVGGYEVVADLAGIGPGPHEVEVFDDSSLVAAITTADGTVAQVSGWPTGGGAAIVDAGPDEASPYSFFLEGSGLTWTLPGGIAVEGDRLRVSATPPTAATPLTSLSILAANIPEITIASGHADPPDGASCAPGPETLCLAGQRFQVEVALGGAGAAVSPGHAVPLSSETGYFWFFDAGNVELVVKVVDGRPVNGHWWVFAGSLSDVAYTITVTDTVTGAAKSYANPSGRLASFADTAAFGEASQLSATRASHGGANDLRPRHSSLPVSDSTAACAAGPQALCLGEGRFRVSIEFENGGSGSAATAIPLTDRSGYFWFFDGANVEVVVKVLDGRPLNGHWWVFFAALSSVEYTVTVTDTDTGVARTYHNPPGVLASRADTAAF